MTEDRRKKQLTLSDGRELGYAEYGIRIGVPLLYFHGFPGSRFDWELFSDDDVLLTHNVRVIAADRPGYGLSDPASGTGLSDWKQDLAQLLNHLSIDQFYILGVSGGGPHALACAHAFGDRVLGAGIVAGMGPSDASGSKDGVSWTLPGLPWLFRKIVLHLMRTGIGKDRETFVEKSRKTMADVDAAYLGRTDRADLFVAALREAFRSGIAGASRDAAIYTRPWDFPLDGISANVHLWHGKLDKNVPMSVAEYLRDAIPSCTATFFEDDGHLTLPDAHFSEIIHTLLQSDPD